MKPNPLPFLTEKWAGVKEPEESFSGKTVLVTGANSGLGFATAAKFASLQADKIILGVRTVSKGEAAARDIEQHVKHDGKIQVWELDMNSFSSVQRFAELVNKELPRLDVAILNAGVTLNEYIIGPEGFEETMEVNVISTALLALLLLPKMKASKLSRNELSHLVIVSSEVHRWLDESDFPPDAVRHGHIVQAVCARPTDNVPWDGLLQNARSKLFAMYISQGLTELAISSNGDPEVIVTPMCPGACKSGLMRNMEKSGIVQRAGLQIFGLLFNKPTEQGAWAIVNSALVGKEFHGCWYKTTRVMEAGSLVTSQKGKEMQQAVWKEIVELLQSKDLGVQSAHLSPT